MNRRELIGRWALLCVLACGCASETVEMWPAAPVHWQPPGTTSASSPLTPTDMERGLAATYAKALASPNFVDLGLILDEEVQFALGALNTHGRSRVLESHEEIFGAFEQRNVVVQRVWLTDSTHPLDSQAIEWTMTGVHARDFMGVAATHKPVAIRGLTLLWTSDSGIISELHVYFDEELLKAQLGSGRAELQNVAAPAPSTGATQVTEYLGTAEEAANVATLRSMLHALQEGSEAEFLTTIADDIDVFTLDSAKPAHGKEAALAHFRSVRRSIRLIDTVIENVWGVQSFVILEYAIAGLQLAPMPRIAFAPNHPLHTQFVDIAEVRGGKIARIWRYADPLAFGLPTTTSAGTPSDTGLESRASSMKGVRR